MAQPDPTDAPSPSDPREPEDASISERGSGGTLRRSLRFMRRSARTGGVLIPLILLWIGLSIASPVFFTALNMRNLFLQSAIVGILAFGATIVLITEEIDLSIGAVEGLAAVVAAALIIEHGVWWPLGIVITLAVGVGVGLLNGLITVVVGVPSFITTLGMLGLATGFAQKISNGETMSGFPGGYQTLGNKELIFQIKLPVIIAGVVLIVLWAVLRYTRLGLNFYAVGGNPSRCESCRAATWSGQDHCPLHQRFFARRLAAFC
jgi:ribose transport system permease protein